MGFVVMFIVHCENVHVSVCACKGEDASKSRGVHPALLIVGKLLQVLAAVIR